MESKNKAGSEENSSQIANRQGRAKLLLVEEDTEQLVYYSSILRRQGYDVRPLSSYREAASHIEQEAFDLVVMSQGEPNFEGRCVLARTVEKKRNLPVLVLAHGSEPAGSSYGTRMEAPDRSLNPLVPSEVSEQVAAYLRLTSHAA